MSASKDASEISQTSPHESDKQSHNMAVRFKNESSQFSGAQGECLQKFVDEYNDACTDYGQSDEQRMQYIHHIILGNAKRYYNNYVKSVAKDHKTVVTLMDNQYNTISRRNRIESYLHRLRIQQFLNEKTNMSDAMEKLDCRNLAI